LKLGFAGTPEFSLPALEALLNSRHRVCAVFTQPDRPSGRGQAQKLGPVKKRAVEAGLMVFQPASFKSVEAQESLRALELDVLVVVAYGLILPPTALSLPKFGCINIHASLLPRWRGAAPIQRALLAGDSHTGISIMRMAEGLDTGPLLAVGRIEIDPAQTCATLHDRLADLGAELIVETLDKLGGGGAPETPQPAEGVTYAAKISKSEALIDWREDAEQILRRVHAFNPWPVAEARLAGAQLRIWEARLAGVGAGVGSAAGGAGATSAGGAPGTVIGASPAGIDVACGRGVLRVTRLQLPGRKPLAAREFIQAHSLVGVSLGVAS
jgi:methionyl-tRNA formyltransferase